MFDAPQTSQPTLDLGRNVMLVSLHISVWAGRKIDRKLTTQLEDIHGIEKRTAGEFTKQTICKPALASLKELAGQARTAHYTRTLPWNDLGSRILSASSYFTYMETISAIRQAFDAEVEKFIVAYPRIIDEARHRLRQTFDINDYPDISGVRERFEFNVDVSPFPTTTNWIVDIASDQMEQIRADHDQRVAHGIEKSIEDVYRRIADVTGKMAERLNAYERDNDGKLLKGKFKDSLVGNVRELADLLPGLNITNDPHLSDLGNKLSQLTRFDPSQLRASEELRSKTGAAAKDVFDMVAAFL